MEMIPKNEDIADENGFSKRINLIGKKDFVVRRSVYYDLDGELHKELNIPKNKLVALGIAIGYPDWSNDINEDFRDREPLDTMVKFYGY